MRPNREVTRGNIRVVLITMLVICIIISYKGAAEEGVGVEGIPKMLIGIEDELFLGDIIEGKRISTIGDSISYNDKKESESGKFIGYQSLLEKKYKIPPIKNRSITGAATAAGTRNGIGLSMVYIEEDFTDTDILIIASGTNDFRLDVELGTPLELVLKEKNMETFYGAYSNLIEVVLKSNPDIEIHLWTPIKRDNAGYNTESINEVGYKLEDYRNAIIDIAKFYKIPCCDMYAESGIELDNLDILTTDGLHPNNKGYEVIYESLEKYLTQNIRR